MAWRRYSLTAAGCLALIYAFAYADLVLRARTAYLEGEKYLAWDREPALKKTALDAELAEKEKALRSQAASGKFPAEDLEQRLFLARWQHDERLKESSLKYAYVWFQTAVELFTPPESKWVVLSRQKMALSKELWKKELDAKKIPYQDYMLE